MCDPLLASYDVLSVKRFFDAYMQRAHDMGPWWSQLIPSHLILYLSSFFARLYSGRECWLTSYGEAVDDAKGPRRGKLNKPTWSQQVSFESYMFPPPHASNSLCQYLNDASEEMGMRTYVSYKDLYYLLPSADAITH